MLILASFPVMFFGACMTFSSVAMSDWERAKACEERCIAEGYEDGRIGPNSDRDQQDRSTWFVACICQRETLPPLEFPADRPHR